MWHSQQSHPPLSWMANLRWPLIEAALRPVADDVPVLEIGCGQGAVGSRLAARFSSYTGVEPDPESAALARERVEPCGGRIVSDLTEYDGPPAGVLCAFEVLEHLEDDLDALRSWVRSAAPGALVVVSVPADPHRFTTTDTLVGHFRRYTDDALRGLLEGAGLEHVTLRRYGFPVAYVLEDVRNVIASRRFAGTADDPIEDRSHTSGRLLQPRRQWEGAARRLVTKPFRVWQDAVPGRGPGLVAAGRVPVVG
jgi:SAM-dependent methyltransferase